MDLVPPDSFYRQGACLNQVIVVPNIFKKLCFEAYEFFQEVVQQLYGNLVQGRAWGQPFMVFL